jgi:hypothetical protein
MPPAEFEPVIPVSEQLQNYTLIPAPSRYMSHFSLDEEKTDKDDLIAQVPSLKNYFIYVITQLPVSGSVSL